MQNTPTITRLTPNTVAVALPVGHTVEVRRIQHATHVCYITDGGWLKIGPTGHEAWGDQSAFDALFEVARADRVGLAAPAKARKPRTSNAPQPIRRCAAISAEFGCDFKDVEARRKAASIAIGREIDSCEQMTLTEWGRFGNAIKFEGLRF